MVTCDTKVRCGWTMFKVCISEVLPLKVISWNFQIVLERGKEHVPKTTTMNHFILK